MNDDNRYGIAWYQKEQWTLLKDTAIDSELFEDTYEAWEKHANNIIVKMISEGHKVTKVPIDVAAFNNWCKSKGKISNGESRSEYVAILLKENKK